MIKCVCVCVLLSSFQESYQTFVNARTDLEKFLGAYLNVLFAKTRKTHDGLSILTKFKPIMQRNILRSVLNDKYVEIFANYDKDLEETEANFDKFKSNPPLPRNAPPIGGAISWARQLLKKIDEPIKNFKENKYIASLTDFNVILRRHQRIAATIMAFESAHLSAWKSRIDDAKQSLKTHLLRKNEKELSFEINSDPKSERNLKMNFKMILI